MVGEESRKLYADAKQLLDEIISKKLFKPRGVFGFWAANSIGDDIQLYRDAEGKEPLAVLHTLRQQTLRKKGEPNYALADFVAPRESGIVDYVGAFAVTAGPEVHEVADAYERNHDDYLSIMTKALGDRFAEAFAEYLHKKARENWGFGKTENLSNDDLSASAIAESVPRRVIPRSRITPRSARSGRSSMSRSARGSASPRASPCTRAAA